MPFVKAKDRNGQEVEVELPAGYAPRAEVIAETTERLQEAFDRDVGKRLAKTRAKALDEAIEDEEQRAKLLERLAPHLPKSEHSGDGRGGRPTKEQVAQLTQEIEAAKVKPLLEQLQQAQATIGQLRTASLEAQLMSAASALKVRPELLKPLFDGGTSPLLAMLSPQFGPDEETNNWFVKRGERFALSAKDPTRPMGVAEFLEQLKTKPEHAGLFVDERQPGADFRQPGGGSSQAQDLAKLPPEERLTRAREMGLKK
jgi:hypothetical protein